MVSPPRSGELRAALRPFRRALWGVAALSAMLNVLTLGGSIYMMMVYDSVLPSRSIPTLVGLFVMVLLAYIFQGFFDFLRQRILADVGTGLDRALSPRIQHAMSEMALHRTAGGGDGLTPMRDLDAVRNWLSSAGLAALIDMPWIVFFMAMLFLLHPYLALTALAGAAILIALAVLTDRTTREATRDMARIAAWRNGMAEGNLRHAEVLAALGMRERMRLRWEQINHAYHGATRLLAGNIGLFAGIGRVLRLILQSSLVTVGAVLVIDGKASAGVVFASSLIGGRALAPVDAAIANWRGFGAARNGWRRLADILAKVPPPQAAGVALPLPYRDLVVSQLTLMPPGSQRIAIAALDLNLRAGQALGVIGPSAAGKTSLARALIGVWRPTRGTVRLDGATLDQWEPDRLGAAIGYLPQAVELIDGSIAANIARFDPGASSEAVIAAARAAGIHEMVVKFPEGYETQVGEDGGSLSAGQRQRIGLARALYGDPFLVVLDEPNSNLDAEGDAALARAIAGVRGRGGIAVIVAHRPSALAQVSHVLIMREGRAETFGEREDVLRRLAGPAAPVTAVTESGR
ncbi:type I secretion system permease/ATPase [Sphingomonas sp. Leaf25]|uniref:type I secretion system permease/ATPase n=1 Tax=Sphingomonas sp. Leaf25 TaxID=1735692 RepID=UPI0006FE0E3F|nr:type I secretion system permease/ATPase [Sphingomonas sp. Leaf25]KQN06626.1 hypothetical protein ASE78_15365 [Sphingomonas sp. Leaf25]